VRVARTHVDAAIDFQVSSTQPPVTATWIAL